ncbi:MAG: tyrosine recombinase [Acidimicrobiales bacterium]
MGRPLSLDGEEFLSFLAVERGRAPASIASYRRDLAAYEDFLAARRLALSEVSSRVVEDYLAYLAASGRKASSNARALSAIRGLHRFCEDERDGTPDPTQGVTGPKLPSAIPKALTEVEIVSLLSAVTGDDARARRDRAILELMYATGMRISELCGLGVGSLDLTRGLALVFGKGSKERLVPFGAPARRAVSAWLELGGRPLMAPARWQRRYDEEAMFISSRGRRMTRQSVWLVVRHAAERVGLEDRVTPHVLRHSCATHLLEHGADIRVVQELLGHAAITTTQVYTKVSGELLRRAYDQAHPRAKQRSAAVNSV